MALKSRNKISAEFNMSSLTDIIFLLLIFFMLTSSLVNVNPKNLTLPLRSQKVVSPTDLAISITKNGKYYIGTSEINVSNLPSALKKAQIKNEQKQMLTIVPETGTPFKYVMQAMTIGRDLGMQSIIATQPKK